MKHSHGNSDCNLENERLRWWREYVHDVVCLIPGVKERQTDLEWIVNRLLEAAYAGADKMRAARQAIKELYELNEALRDAVLAHDGSTLLWFLDLIKAFTVREDARIWDQAFLVLKNRRRIPDPMDSANNKLAIAKALGVPTERVEAKLAEWTWKMVNTSLERLGATDVSCVIELLDTLYVRTDTFFPQFDYPSHRQIRARLLEVISWLEANGRYDLLAKAQGVLDETNNGDTCPDNLPRDRVQ